MRSILDCGESAERARIIALIDDRIQLSKDELAEVDDDGDSTITDELRTEEEVIILALEMLKAEIEPEKIRFDFYGTERYNALGKHPSELIDEGCEFATYEEAEAHGKNLANRWGMSVEAVDESDPDHPLYFHADVPA